MLIGHRSALSVILIALVAATAAPVQADKATERPKPAPTLRSPTRLVGPNANPLRQLPKAKGPRIVFGVMGGAATKTPPALAAKMEAMGAAIAKQGDVVLTGASAGLPDHAIIGARREGGLTIGISSFDSLRSHKQAGLSTDFSVLQFTRLPPALRGQDRPNFMGRELDNIERSDVIVIAGGRFGTLGELAIALEERRPVGVLLGSGGIADITKTIIEASKRAGKDAGAPVIYDTDPARLVKRLAEANATHRASGVSGPLGDGLKPKR